jgi:hypothetical protein
MARHVFVFQENQVSLHAPRYCRKIPSFAEGERKFPR